MRLVLMTLLIALTLASCHGRKETTGTETVTTQTIAPAAGKPAPTGTDAMTQTVDIEDSRSEEDGGVMTSRQEATTGTATTGTATTAAPTVTTPEKGGVPPQKPPRKQ
jgi:hypothetical protein